MIKIFYRNIVYILNHLLVALRL